jgi:hypothetical protein
MTIIDTAQNPEAKSLLLSGRINVAVCPQCGQAGMLSTPIIYHDPEKELLFTHVPPELGASSIEEQRILGDLTNRLMATLSAEKRKGYLLNPRSFLKLERMIEAILEADGITPEMLKARRAKAALLDRLLRASSEESQQAIAQENDEQIDYEFFQLLTLNIELAQANDQEETAKQLLNLRQRLLEWTTTGHEVSAREEAVKSLGQEISREGLLEKLVEAALAEEQAKIETMITIARPAIDYIFYQQLTEHIESARTAGETEREKKLRELRETTLELTAQIDAKLQQAAEEAAQFLQKVLDSKDPEKTIRANLDLVNELFFDVLTTQMSTAERAGQVERVQQLQEIGRLILQIVEENQPPEVRLVSQLMSVEYPDGTQALLEENQQLVSAMLLEIMDLIGEDLADKGQEEAAQQLAQIRAQAAAMAE